MSSASVVLPERPSPGAKARVRCVCWNENGTSLALGTDTGFIIYSTEYASNDPGSQVITEIVRRSVQSGVGHISLYQQSNVVLFSGADVHTNRIVTLWNDAIAEPDDIVGGFRVATTPPASCTVAELKLPTAVAALRLHPIGIVVAEECVIHIFNEHLVPLESYDTAAAIAEPTAGISINDNSIAVATLCSESQALSMLLLGPTAGQVRCVRLPRGQPIDSTLLKPHTNPIRCLAISADGTVGATVSEKGTAIKVIDMTSWTAIRQLNRGTTPNAVYTMAISMDNSLLSCLSLSGTVHVFSLKSGSELASQHASNPRSRMSPLSNAIYLVPSSVASSNWVTNAVTHLTSDFAFATYSLSPPSTSSVVDDIETEASEHYSNAFSVISMTPGFAHGITFIHVLQTAIDLSGETAFAAPQCRLSRLQLTASAGKVEKISTHFLPKEAL